MENPVALYEKEKAQLISRFIQEKEPEFINRHAALLDDYFRDSFAVSEVGLRMQIDKHPYTFLALGGYGRMEQCLRSDVDVLLLFKGKVPDQAAELIREIIYPLWDLGLEVGYAIRSMKECIQLARQDLSIFTSLVDGRFLSGNASVFALFQSAMLDKVVRRHRRKLSQLLTRESQKRHAQFGDSTYLLEPNLKEGLGGLRDYHCMLWMAWAKYQIKDIKTLLDYGHLSPEEFQALTMALSFIWEARNRLHYLSGRKCDQLYFEYQIDMAKAMGFTDRNGQLAVEQFLGTMHGHMEFLKQIHLTFLNKDSSIKSKLFKKVKSLDSQGLTCFQDTLNFESPKAIPDNSHLLIKIFEQSALLRLPLSIEAKRVVRKSLPLIDNHFRSSPPVVQSFRNILISPPQPFRHIYPKLYIALASPWFASSKYILRALNLALSYP